ncbi:penicillin-binding protein activator [Paraglaciecola sp. 20A4]|uniref:penicillin-binding protein activator n=1 Tax=Paraglaciecola sp. 20A4 TaxID=2687288 RepID=UPI00140DF0D0|nr:penicillin-binding protein activator [Paraglaciecola sp. 20A4]
MKLIRSVVVVSLVVFMASCADAPNKKNTVKRPDIKVVQPDRELSSQYYLNQAQREFARDGDTTERNDLLLLAASKLQTEQNCNASIKLLNILTPELIHPDNQAQAQLLLAECYVRLPSPALSHAQKLLEKLPDNFAEQGRIRAVQAHIDEHQQAWLEASKNLLAAGNLNNENSLRLWRALGHLTAKQAQQAIIDEPRLRSWLDLKDIVQQQGLAPDMLQRSVSQWQGKHVYHPLSQALPEALITAMSKAPIIAKRVAVLLPLTGRLASQGNAIKDGIVAAYLTQLNSLSFKNNSTSMLETELRFFDSALKTPQELNDLVADYDVIVGPLLKEKIAELITLLPANKTILALNRIDTIGTGDVKSPATLSSGNPLITEASVAPEINPGVLMSEDDTPNPHPEIFYFSLAPEDEAIQLAKHIYDSGLRHPVVLSADTSTTQRMAEAFLEQWQVHQRQKDYVAPATGTFTDSKSMRKLVSELLDVAQSRQRVKQIELLTTSEVYAVERNRRDVDAIILFANPEQTELLSPIIESSLSPFAAREISVFASSRSYTLDLNKNSIRDLRNLTFIDMPWMMPNNPWAELANEVGTLWPQSQDSLLRLFALGYDAYNLIPKLRHLNLLPITSVPGLSGELSISSDGEVHRVLQWAKVQQDRVTPFAME